MTRVTCDICGKLLLSTENECVDIKTAFQSVRLTLLIDETRTGHYDICPRCLKRMQRYLRKEAKKEYEGE